MKNEMVSVPRELLLECINTAVRAWGVGSPVEVRLWKALAQPEQSEAIAQILKEMRQRRVNNGKHTSPTLEAWADRLEAALFAQGGE